MQRWRPRASGVRGSPGSFFSQKWPGLGELGMLPSPKTGLSFPTAPSSASLETVSLPSAPGPLETPRVQEVESYTAHTQRHFGDSRPFSLNLEQCSKLEEDKMAPSRWSEERKLFPFLSGKYL